MSALREDQMILQNVRLGYPKLFRPEAIKGMADSKPRYGCVLYLPKEDEKQKAKLDLLVDKIAKEQLDGKRPKGKDSFITDGDGEDGDENTKGCWIISANRAESQNRPQVVRKDRTAIDSNDTDKPYAGCYVNALIGVFKPKAWKKVCASLEIVQFVKDGDPFGAAPADVDVMPELSDEEFDV